MPGLVRRIRAGRGWAISPGPRRTRSVAGSIPIERTRFAEEQLIDLRRQLEVGSAGLFLRETEVLRLVAAGLTDVEIAN